MQNLTDQVYLKKLIQENLEFVLFNIGEKQINIHLHRGEESRLDYPRMFYTLYTLSRLYKLKIHDDKIDKEKLITLALLLWQNKDELPKGDLTFVELYGMRMFNNFGESYQFLLTSFLTNDHSQIYSSPVCVYVFMSAYNQCIACQDLEQPNQLYLASIYNNCLKIFDILLSGDNHSHFPFYFSEFGYFKDKVPDYFVKFANKYINDNFSQFYLKSTYASSGVAKTLEHFANVNDLVNFQIGLDFIEKRNYKRFASFRNTNFDKFERVYTEYDNSWYCMLDINTHLINAYVNLLKNYERKN